MIGTPEPIMKTAHTHRPAAPGAPLTARRGRMRGFTLIELMTTIAIAAILMVVAVPSFVQFMRNAELSDAAGNMVSALNAAKSAALKTGKNTYVMPMVGADGWKSGWRVFADNDWDGTFSSGDEVILEHQALPSSVVVTVMGADVGTINPFANNAVLFNGSGYPRVTGGGVANGKLRLSNDYRGTVVVVNRVGRVRSCRSGEANCPST